MSTAQSIIAYLQKYNIQDKGRGRYRSISPLRPDAENMNFALYVKDSEHGAFMDWQSGQSGSLYELAQLLGIDTGRKIVESTERAYESVKDYALAHGVTGEVLFKAGWVQSVCRQRPAIKFNTPGGFRWRFLDGKKPKYLSQPDYKQCWYGLNESLLDYIEAGQPVVIVNGEISTLAARYNQIAGLCVTAGEKRIPDHLLDELVKFLAERKPLFYVALDCDQAGRNASIEIAGQLRGRGYDAYPVDLGLSDKGDFSDFLMLWGGESATRLTQLEHLTPEPPAKTTRKLYHADQLHELPKIHYILRNEIPGNSFVMIYGASGIGKSFVALDYSLEMAQNNTVIYMAGEGQAGFLQRVEAWKKYNEMGSGNLFFYLNAISLLNPLDLEPFIALIEPYLPDVVVIDTLARAMTGSDENSTRDMGLLVQACNKIMERLGCTVLLVHHTSKAGNTERGNSSLRGALDMAIKVSQSDDQIVIECSKTKDSSPFPTRYVKLEPVQVQIDGETLESVVVVPSETRPQKHSDSLTNGQEKIMKLLSWSIYDGIGATWADIKASSDVPLGSLGRILSTLKDLQYIQKNGESYQLTPAGRDKLGGSTITITTIEGDSD